MAEDFETVKLTFDGRIATRGQIHLYEYSRSQYALSRFITTVEQFRRTGDVIDRVTVGRNVDMIVSAPERGTFDLSVLVPIAQSVAGDVAGVPFKALFGYVWGKLLPAQENRQKLAVDLAQVELDRERERTKQSISRDQAETDRLQIVQQIIERKDATNEQLLSLLAKSIDRPTQRLLDKGYDLPELARQEEFLKADAQREALIEQNRRILSRVDPTQVDRLTNKLRPMVSDLALPLRRSADRCYLGDAANDNAYIRLDSERAAQVTSRYIDDQEFFVAGLLRSYDRYTYRGKIESNEFDKTMYFTVDLAYRDELRTSVIEAMRNREVVFRCASYKDVSGRVTSLILRGIKLPD